MIGKILGFWLVNWPPSICMYVCMFIFITYAEVEEAIMR